MQLDISQEITAVQYNRPDFILIGTDPLAMDADGLFVQRIQTFFIQNHAIITVPGNHADQRLLYVDYLNQERQKVGQPKLTRKEEDSVLIDGVALVAQYDDEDNPFIGVRIDGDMVRAQKGREELLKIFSEEQVRLF